MEGNHTKYNYVLFDLPGEYYRISRSDVLKIPDTQYYSYRYGQIHGALKKIYGAHTLARFNMNRALPFQGLWVKSYYSDTFNNQKPTCFIFWRVADYMFDMGLFDYLKKLDSRNKLVFCMGDTQNVCLEYCYRTIPDLKKVFDLVLTYNQIEANQYGYKWYPTVVSKIPIKKSENYPLADVFFVGGAKDRLSQIMQAYDIFHEAGYSCDFNIFNVPQEKRIPREGITYLDRFIPYKEALNRCVNCRAILEITKSGPLGFTARIPEAIMYNKKLFTNNQILKQLPYYDRKHMHLFTKAEDIDVSILKDSTEPDYQYQNDYSNAHFIEFLENSF